MAASGHPLKLTCLNSSVCGTAEDGKLIYSNFWGPPSISLAYHTGEVMQSQVHLYVIPTPEAELLILTLLTAVVRPVVCVLVLTFT